MFSIIRLLIFFHESQTRTRINFTLELHGQKSHIIYLISPWSLLEDERFQLRESITAGTHADFLKAMTKQEGRQLWS
jgi:hypothetical protein